MAVVKVISLGRYPENRVEHAFNDALAYYYPDYKVDISFDYVAEARKRIELTDEEFQAMLDNGFIDSYK